LTEILQTLLPVMLVILLGVILRRIGLLPETFVSGANKLVYFVGLPALVIRSISSSGGITSDALLLAGIFLLVSFLLLVPGIGLAALLRVPFASCGTFLQAGFRANLAFVAIPVLAFAFADETPARQKELLATAALVFAPAMVAYNLCSVVVLQISKHRLSADSMKGAVWELLRNPLILATVVGGVLLGFRVGLPVWADRCLEMLGDFAVPLALLGIGATLRPAELKGRASAVMSAALLKVAVLPALGWAACRVWHLPPDLELILLVFCAAPTAAASYVLVVRMGGDTALASGSIFASTVLSAAALAVVLVISGG
jgi:predicted permease